MSKKYVLIFLAIFILGAFLRFYRLGEIPISFHRDEAFLGYNAWSILQTGKDMNGNFLPLNLQSFIYSPAGYAYFSIPFLKIFGLSVFAVRFASAFFGSLTILAVFFLARMLFNDYRHKTAVGLLSSLSLAISPWHINLCRTATENVLVVFFLTLGIYLWLVWLRKKKIIFLGLSFVLFFSTLLIYQAPRAFLPLFIPVLIVASYFKTRFTPKVLFITFIFYFLTILLPLFLVLRSPELSLRLRTVSIFSTAETQLVINQQLREDGVSGVYGILSRASHNKVMGFLNNFLKNYFDYFSFDFLFTDKGLPPRYHIPLAGLLSLFELPLILMGIWFILKSKGLSGPLILSWLVLAPVGSALTFDDIPNLQRALIVFPMLSLVIALGANQLIIWVTEKKLLILPAAVFLLFALYNFSFYLHQYYIHGPLYLPWHRNDGYQKLVSKVNELLPGYSKAVITNRETAPTIFFLFFGKYDPALFQKETAGTTMKDFDRINFGKYEFSLEECPLERQTVNCDEKFIEESRQILYVDSANCLPLPKLVHQEEEIIRTDNSAVFRIVECRE